MHSSIYKVSYNILVADNCFAFRFDSDETWSMVDDLNRWTNVEMIRGRGIARNSTSEGDRASTNYLP